MKADNVITHKYEFITFTNTRPTNGDTITITSTILNIGGAGAYVDVWFYMDYKISTNLINQDTTGDGSPDPVTILVPMSGQQDAKIEWKASPGGLHMIIVNATVNESYHPSDFYDPFPSDNQNYTNISVMPKILLVDDDSHVNDLSDGDTVSFMRASLEAADFNYEYVIVGAGDGPGYDYGDYPLMEYDVVIWMTGYRETKTLTVGTLGTDDVTNLQKYLTGNPSGTVVAGLNGGSLWLISQGFWKEAWDAVNGPTLRAFADMYLHIPEAQMPSAVLSLPPLYGNLPHPVTDYFADNPINTVERVAGTGNVYYWKYTQITDIPRIALNDSSNTTIYALTYDSDDYSGDTILDSRMLAQTWGFSRIKDTATQAQYTYKAILWLGKINMTFSQDVAISEQTIEPETVFYKQQVTIKFIVRNNGLSSYTGADSLYYQLRITDLDNDDIIVPVYQQILYLGNGTDNTLTLTYNWTPQQIGYHRISIKVDPFNYIEESNEMNNEISSYWGTGELNVLYRVLVVDDDGSHQSGNFNDSQTVRDALDRLGYLYENYTVDMTDDGPAFSKGSNRTALNEYNSVIWVTGEIVNPLTQNDIDNITLYLGIGGNFWLLGNGLWTSIDETVSDAFERNYLKINSVDGDQNMSAILNGVEDDMVSHGMQYACNGDPYADILSPFTDGIGFTYQNNAMTEYNSVRYIGESPNSTAHYRVATTPWLLSSLDDENDSAEFVFMMLRWFDKPESRIEVRIADIDIWITDDPNPHPQLGSGYVIQAKVQNTGGATGNVLVRFMDGSTQIGSDSISVSPNSNTTAEIVWVPLFAGPRTISILVDPIAEVKEIFEWSNNNATRAIHVYFFWDNMEQGASKWAHSSTITLINGEGPLEYFGTTAVSVNIEKDWNYTASQYITNCTDPGFYHTFDKATWLQEPGGSTTTTTRMPIDVVFALDTSGSMSAEIDELVIAVNQFLGDLTDQDRAAIWKFNGTGSETTVAGLYEPYRYCTAANVTYLQGRVNVLDPVNANTYTCFYDTLGSAIQYSQTYKLSDRLEFVIGMTDGVSNSDDVYTPNANWNQVVAGDTAYSSAAPHPTKGLLYPPCMVYTIGLGITHDPLYPTADGIEPEWSRTPPRTIAGNNYPIEYDVWHCADSSPLPLHDAGGKYGENTTTFEDNVGHYYYTNDPTQLESIFQNIFQSIIIVQLEGEPQTRSGGVLPQPMATSVYNFAGVTQAGASPPEAWFCAVDLASDAEFTTPNVEATTAEWTDSDYTDSVTSNNVRTGASGDPGNNDEIFTKFWMAIMELPNTITGISMTYEAEYSTALTGTMYAWNAVGGTWDTVGATQAFAATTDATMTRDIATNWGDYVSGGEIIWGVYASTRATCSVDLVELTITFTPSTNLPPNPPTNPSPAHSIAGVSTTATLSWTCTDPDDGPNGLNYTIYFGTTNPPPLAGSSGTSTSYNPGTLAESTIYYWYVIANDGANTTTGPLWIFATTGASVPGESGTPGLSPDGPNMNKSAVTKAMDLRNMDSAKLEFWHKYNMVPGANGGILMVGYKESAAGPLKWKYVVPSSAYTGNLRLNVTSRVDSFDTFIQWSWNGISGRGTFTWEKVSLNLLPWVTNSTGGHMNGAYDMHSSVHVKFQYYQYGGGTGYGWYIDDVRVTVSRPNSVTTPDSNCQDLWNLTNVYNAHSGNYCWANVDPLTGLMKPGIDNYLMSTPIDLTNARIAYLSAYVKFNLNYNSGAPPDGFRVEISDDNGITWKAVNLGVRSAWNVSGTDNDASDGYPGDGKSYSGLTDSYNINSSDAANLLAAQADGYWVSLDSLTRINIDLSSFSGNAIQIRFRVVTNSDPGYAHSNNANQVNPDFGGFYLDDVIVEGETILT
ncbi:MAG: CARDB domain-containing protein [Thermoplasmata archaeon]|nr:CARDB domain-containing protein [Thermoplasmata archaeon]